MLRTYLVFCCCCFEACVLRTFISVIPEIAGHAPIRSHISNGKFQAPDHLFAPTKAPPAYVAPEKVAEKLSDEVSTKDPSSSPEEAPEEGSQKKSEEKSPEDSGMPEYVEVYDEPLHKTVLENDHVRVIKVDCPAETDTMYHRHSQNSFFLFFKDVQVRLRER